MPVRNFLVGIGGAAGSGKDTLACLIKSYMAIVNPEHTVKIVRFGYAVREAVEVLTDVPVEDMVTSEDKSTMLPSISYERRQFATRLLSAFGPLGENQLTRLTDLLTETEGETSDIVSLPRCTLGRYMQLVGTEAGRGIVGEDVWIRRTLVDGLIATDGKLPNVVIFPDVRFRNELDALGAYAFNVYLTRKRKQDDALAGREADHASEDPSIAYEFDVVVCNDGSPEQLLLSFFCSCRNHAMSENDGR